MLSEGIKKLAKEAGILSVWIGDEKIASFSAPIADGTMVLFSGSDEESIKNLPDKLQS